MTRAVLEDQATEFMEVVRASYSQAAAYVILLGRVEWDLGELADLLWVGRQTVRRRLGRVRGLVAVQPSCFDGVEVIPEGFEPWRRSWTRRGSDSNPWTQLDMWQRPSNLDDFVN